MDAYQCKYLFVILLLFVPIMGSGQTPASVDSLKEQLYNQPDDTTKIITLLKLTRSLKQSDVTQARKYCNQMYKLSSKLHYLPGLIDALEQKSGILIASGNYDSAITICNRAVHLSDSIHDMTRLANNYQNQGVIIFRTKGPEEAGIYFSKSLKLYETLKDSFGMANALNGIGVMMSEQTKNDSAVFYYLEMIKICEKENYEQILVKGFINIGAAYLELGQNERAAYYLLESVGISKKLNKLRYLSQAYHNLGNITFHNNNLDSAKTLYQSAVSISEKTNYPLGIIQGYNSLGNVSLEKGDYNSASRYYDISIEQCLNIGDSSDLLISLNNKGLVQERLGNYNSALAIYDSCLRLADKVGSIYRKSEIYYNIYKAYWLKGDYESAFIKHLTYDSIQDSIFNLKNNKTIAGLRLKYEKGKLITKNLALENDNLAKDMDIKKRTNQRNIYLLSGLGGIFILIFIIAYYRQKTIKNQMVAERRIEKLEEEKKMLAAKYLIEGQEVERKRVAEELHDGLGVLLSSAKIHFTAVRNKSPENRPLIDKASSLLEQATYDVRRISHQMMPGLLTKYGLFEAVEDLIENVNEMEGVDAVMDVKGTAFRFNENKEIMLYRIIQEMFNNTLKHAKATHIHIALKINHNKIEIEYSDDGIGFNFDENMHIKSIGISSINSRVDFLNGQISLVTSPGEGTVYKIQIPLLPADRMAKLEASYS